MRMRFPGLDVVRQRLGCVCACTAFLEHYGRSFGNVALAHTLRVRRAGHGPNKQAKHPIDQKDQLHHIHQQPSFISHQLSIVSHQ